MAHDIYVNNVQEFNGQILPLGISGQFYRSPNGYRVGRSSTTTTCHRHGQPDPFPAANSTVSPTTCCLRPDGMNWSVAYQRQSYRGTLLVLRSCSETRCWTIRVSTCVYFAKTASRGPRIGGAPTGAGGTRRQCSSWLSRASMYTLGGYIPSRPHEMGGDDICTCRRLRYSDGRRHDLAVQYDAPWPARSDAISRRPSSTTGSGSWEGAAIPTTAGRPTTPGAPRTA